MSQGGETLMENVDSVVLARGSVCVNVAVDNLRVSHTTSSNSRSTKRSEIAKEQCGQVE